MKAYAAAGIAMSLALLTFFQFPGHTWLQQDTQIYAPILEHLRDPSVLSNDILAERPHVAYTLFDEAARFFRAATGAGFRVVLEGEQIAARALGIWGFYLMASALGLSVAEAWTVAAIVSLGATVTGPEVLTFEYEPTPRALAILLVACAIGLAAHRRWQGASLAGAAAFLLHPPTALAFWVVFLALAARRRSLAWPAGVFAGSIVLLLVAVRAQSGPSDTQAFFARLTPDQEFLQRMRTAYNWISAWPATLIAGWLAAWGLSLAAFARVRSKMPEELQIFLAALPALGILAMPASWLLLEHAQWSLVPQVQPLRLLLFVALALQFLAAAAGILAARRRGWLEAMLWFALAYAWPFKPFTATGFEWRYLCVLAALAMGTALARRYTPAVALAAFFAIPLLGGVTNYPRLHTPDLAALSGWARENTPRGAVFVFPDAGHSLDPGIFRSEALRAVYVDWKGGGQVNYLSEFGPQWWFRWQQTVGRGFEAADLPRYAALGIRYAVLDSAHKLPQQAVFENSRYAVYATMTNR